MRKSFGMLSILVILLAACGIPAPATTPPLDNPTTSSETATATLSMESAMPTETPSLTPTPTISAVSAVLGPDNFNQFVPVQTYGEMIGNAILEDFGTDPGESALDNWTYSPDGRFVAVGGCTTNWSGPCQSDYHPGDSFLYILDAQTAGLVGRIPENDGTIYGLAFTPDGSKLIYAVCPLKAAVWDMETQEVERIFWQEKGCPSYPKVTVSPDGSQIALVVDTRLLIFDLASGEKIIQLQAQRYGAVFPKYSADGARLAVFSDPDGRAIIVYDTADWQKVSTINVPGNGAGGSAADISPDGGWIVTAEVSENPDILLWDVSSGQQVAAFDEPLEWIEGLAFSPDGRLLLVSGFSVDILETIGIWDMVSQERIGGISSSSMTDRIMFAADGASFVSNGSNFIYETVRWNLPDEAVLAARQAVISFLEALAAGDFEAAASWYQPGEEDQGYLQAAGFDPADIPGTLEAICAQEHQPCMPIYQIEDSGKQSYDEYLIMVSFAKPDGSLFHGLDDESDFWIYVAPQPDGSMRVMNLPYFFLSP